MAHNRLETGLVELMGTSGVDVSVPPLILAQLPQGAVRRVKGQQFGGVGPAERLAQLEQGRPQVQEERVRGVHLEKYFRHLVGPDLGAAGVGLQAASQPGEQQVASLARLLQQILKDEVQLVLKLTHELQEENSIKVRNTVKKKIYNLYIKLLNKLLIYVIFCTSVCMFTHVASSNECPHLVDVGLLNLHFLWTGA